jgi:hypothetical protein
MNRIVMVAASIAISVAGTAAHATCGDAPHAAKHSGASFTPALYQVDEDGDKQKDWYDNRSIVGLWEFEVHLTGAQNGLPDNFLLDWGLATWHEDGTEIQFSAGRAPSAGDVCMGAWRQLGKAEFKLHHIALGLTPPDASGTFVGPTILRAEVHVDPSGESYKGPYTLTVYSGSPANGTEFIETGTPLVSFVGVVSAKRVKP